MGNPTHHRARQPDTAENHTDRGDHNAQDDGIDDGGNHADPEASIADGGCGRNHCVGSDGSGVCGCEVWRTGRGGKGARRWRGRRSAAAAELRARGILGAALVAEESFAHARHYKARLASCQRLKYEVSGGAALTGHQQVRHCARIRSRKVSSNPPNSGWSFMPRE